VVAIGGKVAIDRGKGKVDNRDWFDVLRLVID
jgi:hypothetical protein